MISGSKNKKLPTYPQIQYCGVFEDFQIFNGFSLEFFSNKKPSQLQSKTNYYKAKFYLTQLFYFSDFNFMKNCLYHFTATGIHGSFVTILKKFYKVIF